ncbi:hypothetical protein fugu_008523 [Takifugu bimaculatus]|uniref:Uncharacterized protein n=1 Tax=Takifugu bimaculatus TaxID=433685 RepID=A0A4Z2B1P3_9TELE|nr:hypothetical protein fugu_008523 [Takifugu bimaculatus]
MWEPVGTLWLRCAARESGRGMPKPPGYVNTGTDNSAHCNTCIPKTRWDKDSFRSHGLLHSSTEARHIATSICRRKWMNVKAGLTGSKPEAHKDANSLLK